MKKSEQVLWPAGHSVIFGLSGVVPVPKGSMSAFQKVTREGKAVGPPTITDRNRKALKPLEAQLREEARAAVAAAGLSCARGQPFELQIVCYMPRRSGHYRPGTTQLLNSAPLTPAVKPDLGKLVRAIEDALTGVVYDDDSRIVREVLEKRYADGRDVGCWIKAIALQCTRGDAFAAAHAILSNPPSRSERR